MNEQLLTLREARHDKGLTLQAVETRTGIHLYSLSLIERGLRSPTLVTRRRLETIFGTNINWVDHIKVKSTDVNLYQAEQTLKQLIANVYDLPDKDRLRFVQSIITQTEILKSSFPRTEPQSTIDRPEKYFGQLSRQTLTRTKSSVNNVQNNAPKAFYI